MSDCMLDRPRRPGFTKSRPARLVLLLACAAVFFLHGETVARAQTRTALVIGNGAYQFAPALKNTVNDANLVAKALKAGGFEVTTAADVNRAQLDKALRDFLSKVAATGKETVALIFYAGQGVEIDGDNFLVPVDIKIQREADILTQAVPLSTVLTSMSLLTAAARVVVLDTSRSNPFAAAGSAPVAVEVPRGSIVFFSTSAGGEASEGTEANSPFTVALAEAIKEPGLTIDQVFEKVRVKVSKATNGQQEPQAISGLQGVVPFAAVAAAAPRISAPEPARQPAAAAAPPAGPAAAEQTDSETRRDFELALGINTKEAWDAFLQAHPTGFFADLAKAQLNKLAGTGAK